MAASREPRSTAGKAPAKLVENATWADGPAGGWSSALADALGFAPTRIAAAGFDSDDDFDDEELNAVAAVPDGLDIGMHYVPGYMTKGGMHYVPGYMTKGGQGSAEFAAIFKANLRNANEDESVKTLVRKLLVRICGNDFPRQQVLYMLAGGSRHGLLRE